MLKSGFGVLFALFFIYCSVKAQIQPTLIVHGGAGDITDDRIQGKFDGMKASIRHGYKVLLESDNPLDAVEIAVNIMENLPDFNAGYGAVQTETGEVEMDAIIINGTDLSAGAVGGVRHVQNPISLARLVKDRSEHVFLVGNGAEMFAQSEGITLIPTECLIPPNKTKDRIKYDTYFDVGTVGAVAINSKGQIAVATSTGGMSGKKNGRVGDSPVIGAGSFADDSIGGISGTGWGEAFLRTTVASRVAHLMEQGFDPSSAATEALRYMESKISGADGGIIVISKTGEVGFGFNSRRLAWAYTKGSADGELIHFGIDHGEDNSEPIEGTLEPVFPPECNNSTLLNLQSGLEK